MEKKPRKKHIKYSEGQWFAVPLKDGGYALGIIVRGSYKTKGGLGYFFGPRYENIPDEQETWRKQPTDAILIAQFGDLGIIWGTWPLIPSTRPFRREEWPVPKFKRIDALNPNKGWLVEYSQEYRGVEEMPIREIYCDAKELAGLPEDSLRGYEAVEIVLTELLSEKDIQYSEGQWFAVPLRIGGYALGIIVRGSYKTRGGLGYFFGPRYEEIPNEGETWLKKPSEAILIAWFSGLRIAWGNWPLIPSTRPFRREEWPVPKFKRMNIRNPSKGWLVEYSQECNGLLARPIRETRCSAQELEGLFEDRCLGFEDVEIALTELLSKV